MASVGQRSTQAPQPVQASRMTLWICLAAPMIASVEQAGGAGVPRGGARGRRGPAGGRRRGRRGAADEAALAALGAGQQGEQAGLDGILLDRQIVGRGTQQSAQGETQGCETGDGDQHDDAPFLKPY